MSALLFPGAASWSYGQNNPPFRTPDDAWISVHITDQVLRLFEGDSLIAVYPVSASKFGIGNRSGSFQTPLGWHRIIEKIGESAPIGTVFKSCVSTGKTTVIFTDSTDLDDDLITTRILRLEGLEKGVNRGEGIDSFKRAIYIHGTPEEGLIGRPASHGCIRMKNQDIIDLFKIIHTGQFVNICVN